MSKILDWLFLGSREDATDIKFLFENRIKAVINVAMELEGIKYPDFITVYHIPLDDHPQEDISRYFNDVYWYLLTHRLSEENVLIHCYAGVSRSASFVLMYLIRKNQWNLRTSLAWLRQKRPQVKPNSGFIEQLHSFAVQERLAAI
jgi:protein-tyrosine phosphatase